MVTDQHNSSNFLGTHFWIILEKSNQSSLQSWEQRYKVLTPVKLENKEFLNSLTNDIPKIPVEAQMVTSIFPIRKSSNTSQVTHLARGWVEDQHDIHNHSAELIYLEEKLVLRVASLSFTWRASSTKILKDLILTHA